MSVWSEYGIGNEINLLSLLLFYQITLNNIQMSNNIKKHIRYHSKALLFK